MVEKLTEDERKVLYAELNEWTRVEGRDAIQRKFVFSNFNEA